MNQKPFSLYSCNEHELLERCRERKLSALQTSRAVALFIKNTPIANLAFDNSVDIDTIYKSKQRIKKKLS